MGWKTEDGRPKTEDGCAVMSWKTGCGCALTMFSNQVVSWLVAVLRLRSVTKRSQSEKGWRGQAKRP